MFSSDLIRYFIYFPWTGADRVLAAIEAHDEMKDEIFRVRDSPANALQEIKINAPIVPHSIIVGEMIYGAHHIFPRNSFVYITVLRDPVERIVSEWTRNIGFAFDYNGNHLQIKPQQMFDEIWQYASWSNVANWCASEPRSTRNSR